MRSYFILVTASARGLAYYEIVIVDSQPRSHLRQRQCLGSYLHFSLGGRGGMEVGFLIPLLSAGDGGVRGK